ncbi:DUF4192 family protein [Gordonia pseudamarae]|uniref:DUF4192 family protein n=1 Tax=Gordonia pseudamarae TaxID=2831662 RepID=A0ABX6IGY0_9ACTN|nr:MULTISPECIES: DUF4192 domain-containing protein [Gordonia]MBD0020901.1 DUF4192 domain-containing protein [Gordonia sp. (in: high G+C Gram-positive bacteria)]QHN26238.1 DUF4192 family protein [Gordonia pseudamarae]QHN35131.1 DUF4192 family protein [Gordonia pseudamarae]
MPQSDPQIHEPADSDRRGRPVHAATLITAIPALLGFVPESSLIVLTFRTDNTIIATMRYDLLLRVDGRPSTELRATITGIGDLCRRYGAAAAVAVIVDDRYRLASPQYRTVLTLCDRAFRTCGGLAAGLVATAIADGQRWSAGHTGGDTARPSPVRLPPSGDGLVGDPRTCPTAVREAVTTGRRVLGHREEMTTMLDPVDCGCPRCLSVPDAGGDSAAALRLVIAKLEPGGRRHRPADIDCTEAGALAAALTDLTVRDALLALAVTDLRDEAEILWRALARRLRGSARASAASLLAHLHYIAGEGGYAAVALDCALAADPDWSFAMLLSAALHSGAHPSMLWQIVPHSYRIADSLGIDLPPPTRARAG